MDEADDDLAAQIAWLQQEAALRRQEVARQDAELAELAAVIAENKGYAQELLRREAERWERLAMPDPSFDAALEPKRADHHGEEPFRTLMGYAIRGELEDLAAQMYAYGDPMLRVLLRLSMTVAAYIMFAVCGRLPPTEADMRQIAEITMRNGVRAGGGFDAA